jgi:hypothetical protein
MDGRQVVPQVRTSMIVNNLNIERVAIDEPKLQTPLVIDPDRIPPG